MRSAAARAAVSYEACRAAAWPDATCHAHKGDRRPEAAVVARRARAPGREAPHVGRAARWGALPARRAAAARGCAATRYA
ncbi:hypothetical protein WT83_25335 [Burkholderia territorii]|uniref:Uncharacterized protein n=1 Tax=Burkholderia territorii TaxID=1503055 RepID=A0A108EAW9_9BURK|nr:hypothetical protein WT83_25335 [Burkholderia territorii]